MRLFVMTTLIMAAFAANSVLNRIGVFVHGLDPMAFAVIRTGAGAAMLWAIVLLRSEPRPVLIAPKRLAGAVALGTYMIGFSVAYLTLDAGLGALILFGVLQIIVFAWAVKEGADIPVARWFGAAVALSGLTVLLWPTAETETDFAGAAAMIAAAAGWAAYTLLGRSEADPTGATGANFLLCLPLVAAFALVTGVDGLSAPGFVTAIAAGAITSGLGYAAWYAVLPKLATTTAGIAQLSVPVIAVVGGIIFLNEALSARLILSAALVLGGIAISLLLRRKVAS